MYSADNSAIEFWTPDGDIPLYSTLTDQILSRALKVNCCAQTSTWLALSLIFIIIVIFFCRKKANSNSNLNEAILLLELKIQDANFEKQTFTTRILELEIDLNEKQCEKDMVEKNLNEIKENYLLNEANDRKSIDVLTKNHEQLKQKYATVCENENSLKEKAQFYETENERLELENARLASTSDKSVDMDKYEELEVKINNLQAESEIREQQLEEYKNDCDKYDGQIKDLQNELSLREKTINILQSVVMKDANKTMSTHQLQTINEDELISDTDGKSEFYKFHF